MSYFNEFKDYLTRKKLKWWSAKGRHDTDDRGVYYIDEAGIIWHVEYEDGYFKSQQVGVKFDKEVFQS